MVRGSVALLGAAVLLSGCVSDSVGTDYAAIAQKIGPPKSAQSRIVVLQEQRKGVGMAFCACDVKLDGNPIGKVTFGTYVFADRPAGRHQMVADETLFPGETKYDFTTEPGRIYFLLVKTSQRHDSMVGLTMFGGLAGAAVGAIATSGSDNAGPAEICAGRADGANYARRTQIGGVGTGIACRCLAVGGPISPPNQPYLLAS
jgi:Protein of unknown function (DUF2846)